MEERGELHRLACLGAERNYRRSALDWLILTPAEDKSSVNLTLLAWVMDCETLTRVKSSLLG